MFSMNWNFAFPHTIRYKYIQTLKLYKYKSCCHHVCVVVRVKLAKWAVDYACKR